MKPCKGCLLSERAERDCEMKTAYESTDVEGGRLACEDVKAGMWSSGVFPLAKEQEKLRVRRKVKKDSLLEASERMWPCQHLDFRLASRTVKQ